MIPRRWSREVRLSSRIVWLLMVVFAACLLPAQSARAQGGPPFRTDDPDPPGNRHWEINFGFIADRNPGDGAYQVPDFDINYGLGDRIQLKYELPIAIEETRPQPATPGVPATQGAVIGGLGESLLGVKLKYFEHSPGQSIRSGFGTGLLAVFGHRGDQVQPAGVVDESAGTGEKEPTLELGTYPQLYLDNPTSAVPRGLVSAGPNFYLPFEVSGRFGPIRYNADAGYNFGNRNLPQSWNRGFIVGHEFSDSLEAYIELYDLQDANRLPIGRGVGNFASSGVKARETTLGIGMRQALNKAKTINFLLMQGRSFQKASAANGQPSWIAYVGVQVLLGPRDAKDQQPAPIETPLPKPGVSH
jgi:hypothetical protein